MNDAGRRPKRLPRAVRHLSGLRDELSPATRRSRPEHRATRRCAQTFFTSCLGHKVAAADKCRRETAPRGNSHRPPSVLNPPVWRNKVYVSGGYLTPVITERPTLHRNTHTQRRARAHTAAAAASCFLLLSLSVTAEQIDSFSYMQQVEMCCVSI